MNTAMRFGLLLMLWLGSTITQASITDAPNYNEASQVFPETAGSALQLHSVETASQPQNQITTFEPGTLILVGFGVCFLLFCRKRVKN